jgi:hypothetical protein
MGGPGIDSGAEAGGAEAGGVGAGRRTCLLLEGIFLHLVHARFEAKNLDESKTEVIMVSKAEYSSYRCQKNVTVKKKEERKKERKKERMGALTLYFRIMYMNNIKTQHI